MIAGIMESLLAEARKIGTGLIRSPCLWTIIACSGIYGKILLGEQLFRTDTFPYQMPEKLLIRDSLLRGEVPFINAKILCGSSFLGNMDAGVLNPMNLLLIAGNFNFAYHLFVFAHLLFAGLAMCLFLRHGLKIRGIFAFAGAVSYSFGYVWSSSGNGFYRCAWLVPLFFLCYFKLINSKGLSRQSLCLAFAGSTISSALLLICGNFLEAYFCLIFAIFFTAFSLASKLIYKRRAIDKNRFMLAISSLAISLMLASPAIIPAMHSASDSYRKGGIPLEEAQLWSFPPARTIEYLIPFFFGDRQDFGLWCNRIYGPADPVSKTGGGPFADSIFIGLPIILGLLFFLFRKKNARDIFMLSALLFSILLSFGRYTPLYSLLYHVLPGFNLFRHPEKFLFWTQFWLIACGSLGLNSVPTASKKNMRIFLAVTGALSTILIASLAVYIIAFALAPDWLSSVPVKYGSKWNGERIFIWGALVLGSSAISSAILFSALRLLRGNRCLSPLLIAAVSVAQIYFASSISLWTIPGEILEKTSKWTDVLPETGLKMWRISRTSSFHWPLSSLEQVSDRFVAAKLDEYASLECNAPALSPFTTPIGFSPVLERSYSEIMNLELNDPERVMDESSVRYIACAWIANDNIPLGSRAIISNPEKNFCILENTDARPIFSAVQKSIQIPEAADARFFRKKIISPGRDTIFVEKTPSNFKDIDCAKDPIVKIIPDNDSRRYRFSMEGGPVWLRLNMRNLDGWSCRNSKNEKLEIVSAQGGMMAVFIPECNDEIIFEFFPPGLQLALLLFLAGILSIFIAIASILTVPSKVVHVP